MDFFGFNKTKWKKKEIILSFSGLRSSSSSISSASLTIDFDIVHTLQSRSTKSKIKVNILENV
jgi:hypothetical protein